ncbi:MAG: BA14K family protein [Microbacterium sp.]|nr:BA14K family protein [Microbacterium sp.]
MKPILLLLGSLVLLVLVFLSGVIITANVIAEPEPHKFAHMDTPDLWTSRPKPVDTARQAYERAPAATPPVSVAAETQTVPATQQTASVPPMQQAAAVPAIDNTVTTSVDPQQTSGAQQRDAVVDTAQAEWCYARYRSYRVEDNSYQPFSGGPRRQCQAPGVSTVAAVSPVPMHDPETVSRQQDGLPPLPEEPSAQAEQPADHDVSGSLPSQEADTDAAAGSHEEWCFARYRSYQVGDNSYQPFTGGPRRQCQSPFG